MGNQQNKIISGKQAQQKIQSKTGLAKLLASENLKVIHDASARTASFSPEERILVLPVLKRMTGYIYDAFIGHEVSHALYTPKDKFKKVMQEDRIPHPVLNVVEDARIEKLIQRKFPGLKPDFYKFYKDFGDYMSENGQDFFDLKQFDGKDLLQELDLINRLNLHFKIGDFYKVPFHDHEKWAIRELQDLETWEDVLAACEKVWDHTKKNSNSQGQMGSKPSKVKVKISKNPGSGSGNQQIPEDAEIEFDDSEDEEEQQDNSSENENSEEENTSPEEDQNGSKGSGSTSSTTTPQQNSSKQGGSGLGPQQAKQLKEQIEEIFSKFEENFTKNELTKDSYVSAELDYNEYDVTNIISIYQPNKTSIDGEYTQFIEAVKPTVNQMISLFNMKKSADDYKKIKFSKTGKLNMKKLHKSGFENATDLFLTAETVAESDNHGLVVFVDFSGSMDQTIHSVIKQLLVIVEFCRKTRIPIQVFSFTDGNYGRSSTQSKTHLNIDGNLSLKKIFCSNETQSKMKFTSHCSALFSDSKDDACKIHAMGGTPLNSVALVSGKIVRDFCKTFNKQHTSILLISDGGAGDTLTKNGTHIGSDSRFVFSDPKTSKNIDIKMTRSNIWHNLFKIAKIKNNIKSLQGIYLTADYGSGVLTAYPDDTPEQKEDSEKQKAGFHSNSYAKLSKGHAFDAFLLVKPSCFAMSSSQMTNSALGRITSHTSQQEKEKAFSEDLGKFKNKLVFMKYFVDILS